MENLLQGIVSGHKETQKKLEDQTVVLNKILAIETKRADIEKKQLNEDKRQSRKDKKKESDKGLKALLKKDKDDKKDKKSFLSSLLGLLGGGIKGLLGKLFAPLTNMLAPLKGLGAKLAKTFASSIRFNLIDSCIVSFKIVDEGLGLIGSLGVILEHPKHKMLVKIKNLIFIRYF